MRETEGGQADGPPSALDTGIVLLVTAASDTTTGSVGRALHGSSTGICSMGEAT